MEQRDSEFEKFDRTMDDLLKVTPAKIKADLEAEKKAKAERNRQGVTPRRKRKPNPLTTEPGKDSNGE